MNASPSRLFYSVAIFIWCWLAALLGMLFGYRVSAIVFFIASALNAAAMVLAVSKIGAMGRRLTPPLRWRAAALTSAVITSGDVLFFHFFLRWFYVWVPLGTLYGLGIAAALHPDWETEGLSRWEKRTLERVRIARQWLLSRWEIKDLGLRAVLVCLVAFAPRSKDALLFLPWVGLALAVTAEAVLALSRRRFAKRWLAFLIVAMLTIAAGLLSGFFARTFRSRLFLPSYAHGVAAAALVFFLAWRRARRISPPL